MPCEKESFLAEGLAISRMTKVPQSSRMEVALSPNHVEMSHEHEQSGPLIEVDEIPAGEDDVSVQIPDS